MNDYHNSLCKEQILHNVTLAFIVYRNLCKDEKPLEFEQFFQDYENVIINAKSTIDNYIR